MSDKNRTSTRLAIFGCRMFAVAVLFAFAAVGTAFAETITRTFEFGPGTPYTRSNVRTFPGVPCRKAVAVTVKFQTLGTAGASNLVPITIELKEPDTAPDQEGPLVQAKNITARTTEQTVTLSGALKDRGCSLPWRVRVEHANAGAAPFLTTGTIKLDFDSAVRNIRFNPNVYIRGKKAMGVASTTVNLGSTGGREEGTIVLMGNWRHYIIGIGPGGPKAILLGFDLIDPNGTVVKSAEGYADRQSERDQGMQILKLVYRVTKYTPGQWKLKIFNYMGLDDVLVEEISETFTPDCP